RRVQQRWGRKPAARRRKPVGEGDRHRRGEAQDRRARRPHHPHLARRRARHHHAAVRADGPRDGGERLPMRITGSLVKLIAFAVVTVLATGVLATTISNASFTPAKEYKAVF